MQLDLLLMGVGLVQVNVVRVGALAGADELVGVIVASI